MSKKIIYYDIGHRSAAVLWIFRDGEIETNSVVKTHPLAWPEEKHYELMWAGRYEPETGRCSVSMPITHHDPSQLSATVPSWLVSKLEEKFGSDITIIPFGFGQCELSIPEGKENDPIVQFELNRRKGKGV